MKILASVEVQFHENFGISLKINDIDPNFTIGERERIRQEILRRLTEENLIYKNKLLEIPLVTQKIAVISSANSAGYEDFRNQLMVSGVASTPGRAGYRRV